MIGIVLWSSFGLFCPAANSAPYKVLVVMSYDSAFSFVLEIKDGIESVLARSCKINYFYMDTKRNIAGGPQKAREAYALYRKLRPDGVIASDDNAQAFFVVPFLKDKVKTPVMFCGVNAEPEKYGYPASNVSGILERHHISQSLALAKQLIPSVKTFGYMANESPSGRAIFKHFQREKHTFPVKIVAAKFPKTLKEVKLMAGELKQICDVLFVPLMQGLKDEDGKALTDKQVIPVLAKAYGKPIIGGNRFNIKYGILCGIAKTGQEQGETAARMLLKAMEGTPISKIPITRNHHGRAMINVTVMKAFGIKPEPILLKGTELIETE
jgi:ABC-type uncharacterized transport system substrate-binding protein